MTSRNPALMFGPVVSRGCACAPACVPVFLSPHIPHEKSLERRGQPRTTSLQRPHAEDFAEVENKAAWTSWVCPSRPLDAPGFTRTQGCASGARQAGRD